MTKLGWPHFEMKRFGDKYQCVPIAFWDTADAPTVEVSPNDPHIAALVADFERELLAVGLISPVHGLRYRVRGYDGRAIYRVGRKPLDFTHGSVLPSVKAAPPSGAVPPFTEVPKPDTAKDGAQSRAKSGASLDGVAERVSARVLVRMQLKRRRRGGLPPT